MGFKNTLELVTKDIQDIENLVSNFQNYSKLPLIELDLSLSKLQNVYDLLLMIRDHEVAERSMNSEEDEKDKVLEMAPEPIQKAVPEQVENKIENEKIEVEKESFEAMSEEAVISEEKDTQNETHIEKEVNQKAKTISEKFEKGGDFLNEKLAGKKNNVSDTIHAKPVKSIAGSMGVNDKFYFMRELFDGKAEEFRGAIESLDNTNNYDEAANYLSSKFNWDMDSEPVQSLLNLVRRKFITSENE